MSEEETKSKEKEVDPEREAVLNEMKAKAKEIHTALSLMGKEYTLEDYLAFSFITFMNASSMVPEFLRPTRHMLNMWVDGKLQMEEMLKNGILSLEKK
jgi:hypothetical protein